MNSFIVWVAQGFGIGKAPVAPGTFGSMAGIVWLAMLLATRSYWLIIAGAVAGVLFSIWFCGLAEQVLQQIDSESIVLDEIVAVPLSFMGWISVLYWRDGILPAPEYFYQERRWLAAAGVFFVFRLFDIWKPWPVRQSQALIGGLGITMDDVLAAGYVNAVVFLAMILHQGRGA